SRQLGAGGIALGRRIAARLGAAYVDREILRRAAEELGAPAEELGPLEETAPSVWQALLQSFVAAPYVGYVAPPLTGPGTGELQRAEAAVMIEIARQRDAVIVGRAGFHVLAAHPRHLSVFLHADEVFRRRQVELEYEMSTEEAQATLRETDRTRARYLHSLTGREWTDSRQYHLALRTSALGLPAAEEVLVRAACARFGLGER
ncbi:MAG TPA: cytidylate kinase-like family protein, partial [Polyangia bacterium]